jgi:integrase
MGDAMAVRKRTWAHKGQSKSAWVVDYFDLTGARRLKTFKTKAEAQTWAASTHMDIRRGTHVADGASMTIAEAAELWLATNRADGLERMSIARNAGHVRNHIGPRIGAMRLNQLTVPTVRAFGDQLRADGISKSLAKAIITSLSGILSDAQERGLAMANPVRELRRNRGKRGQRQESREAPLAIGVDIPARDEIRALLAVAAGRRRAFLAVLAFSGLRISELRGLRWQDVDLRRATIAVRQRADLDRAIGRVKSEKAYRTVPLMPLAVVALKEWKLACPKGPLDLVFPDDKGEVAGHKKVVEREWHALQIAAGLGVKYSGIHCLRHFFASWCAARREDGGLGLPLKIVSERCGHSDISTTANVYGHLFPATDDAELMAAAERSLMGV